MAIMNQVREAMHARPFQPFVIHLVDGRSLPVPHPDFVAVANMREMLFVGDDERIHHIASPLVVDTVIPPPPGQMSAAPASTEGNGV